MDWSFLRRTHSKQWYLSIGGVGVVALLIGIFLLMHPAQPFVTTSFRPSQSLQRVTAPHSNVIGIRPTSGVTLHTQKQPLLIFLPATGATTQLYADFEQLAVKQGYHVLAVPYANKQTERRICGSNSDCYGDVHQQQVTGEKGDHLSIASTAAITPTIESALQTLNEKDPRGKWNQYLHNGSLNWSDTVLAGHSQGGAVAAYIAHQHAVKAVIMLASPNDIDTQSDTTATWMLAPSATPNSRYFGLTLTADFYHHTTEKSWQTLLPHTKIASIQTAVSGNQQLFSSTKQAFPPHMNPHFATALDPSYAPVWNYFLTRAKS